ncbi:hypothetical protein ACIRCZ_19795 [Leifsonia sp. NPDC102414]|uniref:hypothetical protein n=1 Tax=Leifsonia sp. NPDC102414 TaxID=3364124 RepID=UPI00381A7185
MVLDGGLPVAAPSTGLGVAVSPPFRAAVEGDAHPNQRQEDGNQNDHDQQWVEAS